MTKEYIGEEFRKPYCEALAVSWAVVEWECRSADAVSTALWFSKNSHEPPPSFTAEYAYRFKPAFKHMVTMYDAQGKSHQLVAPERKLPKLMCFYIDSRGVVGSKTPSLTQFWLPQLLEAGNIFLTREDAQAMADFQHKQRLGEV